MHKDVGSIKSIISEYLNKNVIKSKSDRDKAFREIQDEHK